MTTTNSFGSKANISIGSTKVELYRLDALLKSKVGDVETLPYSLRILLENLLRYEDGKTVRPADIAAVAGWNPRQRVEHEVQLRPARVLMQDFTGVPAVCDLAAMRDAFVKLGLPGNAINPLNAADLVIDHSVQIDEYGTSAAFRRNVELEYLRNRERYLFLRWGQQAFANMKVVPPGTGICHQVNLEYLAKVVWTAPGSTTGSMVAYPDSLVGTDSHTTMINGLGVFGWGVGGIEAEAVMLGQPMAMLIPEVIGFELTGTLPPGATATDLVLTVTEILRKKGVVDKFVEFTGAGLSSLSLPDRATIANMAPEYGATMGFFPVDAETLAYLRFTGRPDEHVQLVERYCKENMLWHEPGAKLRFSEQVTLDLGSVERSLAGPSRPQDRVSLHTAKRSWRRAVGGILGDKAAAAPDALETWSNEGGHAPGPAPGHLAMTKDVTTNRGTFALGHGSIVIASITSCTNTSNPSVLMAAGLLARKAVARGLTSKPWVKTSLAPGSQVVTDYLSEAGVMADLEALGFFLAGYGCTTCIGNSGPVDDNIAAAIKDNNLVVCSVLSGNRNFEGRVNPVVRANYLASPPLVVAYAIAGTMNIDLDNEPLGTGSDGKPVFLKDLWPTTEEVASLMRTSIRRDQYEHRYAHVLEGDADWKSLQVPAGDTFAWDDKSTYIRKPSFFDDLGPTPKPLTDICGARVLAILGDSVTTDHISPAGNIAKGSPAARYLDDHGVKPADYNQYGARRGNHEVMVRGTFANIRLKNLMLTGIEGGFTKYFPKFGGPDEQLPIYDAALRYATDGIPLVVMAGEQYGTGSSRDWAAKGTLLLGVRAVIAKSFERIHRSNLIGMGVLPLQFAPGEDAKTLGLTGNELITIEGIAGGVSPKKQLSVRASAPGSEKKFTVTARIDGPQEVEYMIHGGILQYVLRQRAAALRG
ncbi:MAG: aconitate hydratase AcnA [Deltaproteobacteria bacterium]|nr:aconitate hydratase AcnA [Deltaproteobacteria bacterium]